MKKTNQKSWLKKIGLSSMALVLGLSFVGCGSEEDNSGDAGDETATVAYLAVDINPSVEILVQGGKVVGVYAVNDDANVLLSGEDLTGKTPEQAVDALVSLAEEMGYLSEDNADVKITVAADDDSYAEKIEKQAKAGVEKASALAKVNVEPRFSDKRKAEKLRAEDGLLYKDVTPAKVRLIEAIMQYDETMTYELGAAMTFEQLTDMLKEYREEYVDFVSDELEERFEQAFEEMKLEVERQIAAIYGEEYLSAWEKYSALNEAVEALEDKAENAALSDEDVQAILQALGLEDSALISFDGVVTVDSVEWYIDRYLDDDRVMKEEQEDILEAIEETVEDILDKYDEDEYLLSADELAALSEIVGESITAESLEELETFVEEQKASLEALLEGIELTPEQKIQISALKDSIRRLKDRVREGMQTEIEKAKEAFGALKAEKRGLGRK